MSKTIQEQIEVMQHFLNGGEVEIFSNDNWVDAIYPGWNWNHCDYRIKEQKKIVTIEKWLCKNNDNEYFIKEACVQYLQEFSNLKIKTLETYEVEL